MTQKYWARHGRKQVGPCATRQEALDAFEAAYPFIGPDYMARARKNQLYSGYGESGIYFDLRWADRVGNRQARESRIVSDYISEGLGE